jgi:hypothetical protein
LWDFKLTGAAAAEPGRSAAEAQMDRDTRKRLIDKALALMDSGSVVAVPADEYFAGNTDDWSFGRHMQTSRDIPVAEYAAAFRAIGARPDVEAVYVQVHEVPDDEDPEERAMWPSAFVVFVLTSAPAGEVAGWLRPLEPRYADADGQPAPGVAVPWPEPPAGMRPVLVEML